MRMNISVPDELKKRMDAVKEEVNWSALACRAFVEKLGEIAESKERKTMKDVIDRLRASKGRESKGVSAVGREAGKKWAMNAASAFELGRLDRFVRGGNEEHPFSVFDDAYTPSEHFYFIIRNKDDDRDRSDASNFWDGIEMPTGLESDDEETFVNSFSHGALEVWDRVRTDI